MNMFDASPDEGAKKDWARTAAFVAAAAVIPALVFATWWRHDGSGHAVDSAVAVVSQGRGLSAPTPAPQARRFDAREAAIQYLQFEPNRGQAMKSVRFLSRGPEHSLEVFDDGMALSSSATRSDADERRVFHNAPNRCNSTLADTAGPGIASPGPVRGLTK